MIRPHSLALLGALSCGTDPVPSTAPQSPAPSGPATALPAPPALTMPLGQALNSRRSQRSHAPGPLALEELTGLLLAAQAVTGQGPHQRSIPSAGALHPLEIYLVAGEVEDLDPGAYHYRIDGSLERSAEGDLRDDLMAAALDQAVVGAAPATIVITADYPRTTDRYGDRGRRYVHMEVGHAAQNVYLAATALGLGTVSVGAFDDRAVMDTLDCPWTPLLIMPVGRPAQD